MDVMSSYVRSNPILLTLLVLSLFANPSPGPSLVLPLVSWTGLMCPLAALARPTLVYLNFVFGYKMESET